MLTEIVHIGRNNTIDLVLMADGSVPSLSSVTRMMLTLDDGTVIDSAESPGVFDWGRTLSEAEAARIPGAQAGNSKLVLALGGVIATAGSRNAELAVYDAENPLGIDWGWIRLVAED